MPPDGTWEGLSKGSSPGRPQDNPRFLDLERCKPVPGWFYYNSSGSGLGPGMTCLLLMPSRSNLGRKYSFLLAAHVSGHCSAGLTSV